MGDADDAELLAPSTHSRVSRATYPFTRHRAVETACGEAEGSTGMLRVVYDRHFDRFFLREEPSGVRIPAKSPEPRRVGSKISTARKRSSIASVQWEDLILPPRSVAKKSGDIAGKCQGPSDDAASSGKRDTLMGAAQELVEPATVLQSHETQKPLPTLRTQQRGTTGTLEVSFFTGQGHQAQESSSSNNNACDRGGGARPPTIGPDSPGLDTTQKEAQTVATAIEMAITDDSVVVKAKDSSQLCSKTATATPLPGEMSVSAIQANSEDDCVGDHAQTVDVSKCVGFHASEPSETQPQSIEESVSAPEPASNDSVVSCPVGGKAESSESRAPTPRGSHVVDALSTIAADARLRRVLRRYIRKRLALLQAPTTPVESVGFPAVPTTEVASEIFPIVSAGQETLVVQDVAALQLDLSTLRAHEQSPRESPKSPHQKSPKKHARVPSYARHFEKATAASAAQADQGPSALACLYVDNQNEHDVRWQGDVVHVNIDIATHTNDWESVQSRDSASTQVQQQQRPLLGHVFRLRALARIRPHADGFRRVNESCTFTPLTSSSSESSESDDDPIAVVQVPSSSDDEKDEPVAFKRGDRVLFHARHRWFQGTIQRRIKSSWFYDIRAANGSVLEAVQATRIRRFDGQDDTPVYSFVIGDRVLWRPGDAAHENYRARVVSIRRASSSSGKRYDLELLTGRVVKKVPHDELRPLRSTR